MHASIALAITLAAALGGTARAQIETPKLELIAQRDEIAKTAYGRVQREILDRMLGEGKASVFVDVEVELKASRRENLRFGAGAAEKNKIKDGAGSAINKSSFILPGVPKPKNILEKEEARPAEAAQTQTAQQTKTDQEETYTQELVIKKFLVSVIHDSEVLKEKAQVDEARRLIVEALRTWD
ncbi:MAG: hypothetical protein HYV15_05365, partial [Elusimicrobia bacterium]|nr:hypothetical protein [Elusimicrobiota bacterium]